MKQDGCITKSETLYCAEEKLYLSYHLICERGVQGRMIYDLQIEQMGAGGYEQCRLCDIATSPAMAMHIWQLFRQGLVTPITAQDILEQLLCDEAFLYDHEA